MNTSDEQVNEECGSCGRKPPIPIQWSPIWNVYLCHDCRSRRIDREIHKIVQANIGEDGKAVVVNGS